MHGERRLATERDLSHANQHRRGESPHRLPLSPEIVHPDVTSRDELPVAIGVSLEIEERREGNDYFCPPRPG